MPHPSRLSKGGKRRCTLLNRAGQIEAIPRSSRSSLHNIQLLPAIAFDGHWARLEMSSSGSRSRRPHPSRFSKGGSEEACSSSPAPASISIGSETAPSEVPQRLKAECNLAYVSQASMPALPGLRHWCQTRMGHPPEIQFQSVKAPTSGCFGKAFFDETEHPARGHSKDG